MIENLSKIKTNSKNNYIVKDSHLSDEQVDVLIEKYQKEIKTVVSLAQSNPFILSGVKPEAGALFALDV